MIASTSAIYNLPVRLAHKKAESDVCTLEELDKQLVLLMSLVSRVKSLPGVSVKEVPMMLPSGETVMIPGAWSLDCPRRSRHSSLTDCEDEDPAALDDEQDESRSPSPSSPDRFVVRNEFGHARLHSLLEMIDALCDANHNEDGSDNAVNPKAVAVGGHCVLSPDIFEECVDKGWGCKHPFAGRFHPITGTTVPGTTLLFFSPRDELELNALWNIIVKSYEWAKAAEA